MARCGRGLLRYDLPSHVFVAVSALPRVSVEIVRTYHFRLQDSRIEVGRVESA